MQFATAVSQFFNLFIMKKLSRDEMKKVMGGSNGCGEYEGQTTYICGWRNDPNDGCHVDYCYCNGTVVPEGCDVLQEDQAACG